MKTENSDNRLPDFGMTRGQTIFRFNHQEIERQNEAGETEKSWTCNYVLVDDQDRDTLIDAVMSANYSRSQELALINNKDLSDDYAAEYAEYQAYRATAKAVVDEALS